MTEHRIDTGSPEEKVKAKYPDAYVTHAIYEDSVRRLRIFTIWRPQPGAEKDCVQRLSGGWDYSEEKAWESAASRLETK